MNVINAACLLFGSYIVLCVASVCFNAGFYTAWIAFGLVGCLLGWNGWSLVHARRGITCSLCGTVRPTDVAVCLVCHIRIAERAAKRQQEEQYHV